MARIDHYWTEGTHAQRIVRGPNQFTYVCPYGASADDIANALNDAYYLGAESSNASLRERCEHAEGLAAERLREVERLERHIDEVLDDRHQLSTANEQQTEQLLELLKTGRRLADLVRQHAIEGDYVDGNDLIKVIKSVITRNESAAMTAREERSTLKDRAETAERKLAEAKQLLDALDSVTVSFSRFDLPDLTSRVKHIMDMARNEQQSRMHEHEARNKMARAEAKLAEAEDGRIQLREMNERQSQFLIAIMRAVVGDYHPSELPGKIAEIVSERDAARAKLAEVERERDEDTAKLREDADALEQEMAGVIRERDAARAELAKLRDLLANLANRHDPDSGHKSCADPVAVLERLLGESGRMREVVDAARALKQAEESRGDSAPWWDAKERVWKALAALNPPSPPTVEERVAALEAWRAEVDAG